MMVRLTSVLLQRFHLPQTSVVRFSKYEEIEEKRHVEVHTPEEAFDNPNF